MTGLCCYIYQHWDTAIGAQPKGQQQQSRRPGDGVIIH